ncbi:MAG: TraR/DksA family transcriptional regulator [Geobacter sp.]|nr:TraR/DksA family transcriptional regulator [Geobacter sp.]
MATKPKAKPEAAPKAVKKKITPVLDTDVAAEDVQEKEAEVELQAEVVATAPAGPKDQKWAEIRVLLNKIKTDTLREISKSVRNGTEAVAAIEPGGDIYDQASSERDRELGLLLGDREREKVHSIDEALLRIDEGEYGICEECDEDIPLGRLKAMPFTRHCVKCKSDLEKLQAQTKRVEEERAYREIPIGSEEEEG